MIIENPFKALNHYTSKKTDVSLFRGRDDEIKALVRILNRHVLTVVYGPSGVGKTSLINAGLIPNWGEDFLPISIKINFEWEIDNILIEILKSIPSEKYDVFLYERGTLNKIDVSQCETIPFNTYSRTLWEILHRIKIVRKSTNPNEFLSTRYVLPVLIFDQFEELFTIAKYKSITPVLKTNLIDVIGNYIPQEIKDQVNNDDEELDFSYDEQHYRIIISLREDYLSHFLNAFSSILFNKQGTIRINYFNRLQAKRIVDIAPDFKEKGVDENILDLFSPIGLNENDQSFELIVEPSILSLLCFQFFELLKSANIITNTTEYLTKSKDLILERFYNDAFKSFNPQTALSAMIFIEDRLLTNEGFRTRYIVSKQDSFNNTLTALVQKRILAAVSYSDDHTKNSYEIVHDILIPIIKKHRDERLNAEKVKKIKKTVAFIFIGVLLFLFLISAVIFAIYSNSEKNKIASAYRSLKLSIVAESLLDDDPTTSFDMLVKANNISKSIELDAWIQKVYSENPLYNNIYSGAEKIYSATTAHDSSGFILCEGKRIVQIDTTGRTRFRLFATDDLIGLSLSPDGNMLVASDDKGKVTLWNYKKKKIVGVFFIGFKKSDKFNYSPVLFINNAEFLMPCTISNHLGGVKIVNIKTHKQQVFALHSDLVTSIQKTNHKNQIITTSLDSTVCIFDVNNPKAKRVLIHPLASCSAYSTDGKFLVTGGLDHSIRLWNYNGRMIQKPFLGPNSSLVSLCFLPDNVHIIGNYFGRVSVIWNLDGSQLCTLKGNKFEVVNSFPFTNNVIYTVSGDKTVKKWNISNFLTEIYTTKSGNPVLCARFSPDSKQILACIGDSLFIWDRSDHSVRAIKTNQSVVNWASWSKNGSMIVSGGKDGSVKIWSTRLTLLKKLTGNKNEIMFVNFVKNDSCIISTSMDNTASYRKLNGDTITILRGENTIYSAWLFNNCKNILTCSRDSSATIWNLKGRRIKILKFNDRVKSCAISNDENYFAFGVWGENNKFLNTIYLYNRSFNLVNRLDGHKSLIYNVSFSPDNKKIISSDVDNTAILWDIEGSIIKRFRYHSARIPYCEFSPNNKNILTCSYDNKIAIWKNVDLWNKK